MILGHRFAPEGVSGTWTISPMPRAVSDGSDYDSPELVNIGTGEDLTIRELAGMIGG